MGLDMYLYRIKKLTRKEVKQFSGSLVARLPQGILALEAEWDGYSSIIPYADILTLKEQLYDYETMKVDTGIPENMHIVMEKIDKNASTFEFADPKNVGDRRCITIPDDIIDERYTIERNKDYIVCHYQDIGYWRKEYDIQSRFYEEIGAVENCGYYVLTDATLASLVDDGILTAAQAKHGVRSAIVYSEWY